MRFWGLLISMEGLFVHHERSLQTDGAGAPPLSGQTFGGFHRRVFD